MFNDQPIELGVSTFQVEAQIFTKPNNVQNNKQIRMTQEKIESGLVTVQVTAILQEESAFISDDVVFRRIQVKQDIIEINHEKVAPTNAGHQIIDMFACDSFIKWSVDPDAGLPPPFYKGKLYISYLHSRLCSLFFFFFFFFFYR
jgi:hypothetical protein